MNSDRGPWRALTTIAAFLGFGLLYVPLLAVAMYSFNAAERGLLWTGFSVRWYIDLFADPETSRRAREIREVAVNTLLLGGASTLVSTVLGTLLALGMRFPWTSSVSRLLESIVDIPAVAPDITFAAVLVMAFNLLRRLVDWFDLGMTTMIIGHVTFEIAFVTLIVRSRLISIGPTLSEAAMDLYASSWIHFRRVTLPLLWPAIVGGAMLAFTMSLNDFVISFFTSGPRSVTLPLFVYHSQVRGMRTDLFAISTILVFGVIVFIMVLERLTRWRND
ncbi:MULTISPECIES: ABC transporter permease [Sorangium]|uniref:Putrescine/spermidine ABC transporter permease n=1 Tax=Sorangium cellulosum TaxID=56 RepID=A0A4P2R5K7_SORCE|nr:MULTISPECIES: ABC transporter permease [Sorangium]AUX38414.1 putrescine/spermidine ABC transporter permease [Sorangium cellulosum]WCQ97702.1 Inner membrane ABC transporter permease protein YdcV [Sorangium sp. Soce836]